MLFKWAARGDERAFMVVQNVSASSITTGYPVLLATASASFNGTQAIVGAAAGLTGFIGVAFQDVPPNAYGLIQNLGPTASVFLSNVGSSLTINVGDPLVPGPVGFFSAAPTFANGGFKYVLASNVPVAVSAAGYASGYVRAI
jgi:hypothetical protein